VLDEAIDAAAAWAALQTGTKFVEIGGLAGGDNFHVTLFGVAHPATKVEFAGLAVHEPAEANTLHAALNEEV
jgi:hypothetical protein